MKSTSHSVKSVGACFARLWRALAIFASLCVAAQIAFAQSNDSASLPAGAARITGTVTLGGKPAVGVMLLLYTPRDNSRPSDPNNIAGTPKAKTQTDAAGNYAFVGLPAGNYIVFPSSPALSLPPAQKLAGKTLSVGEAESVEGVDFALLPGGVITGRVSRADGRPVIGAYISAERLDGSDFRLNMKTGAATDPNSTDDRGIYRMYGLSPGNYRISAFLLTGSVYCPGVANKALARIITVSGDQTDDANITVVKDPPSYEAMGRVIDADTGIPVSTAGSLHYSFSAEGEAADRSAGLDVQTDKTGQFRLQGLLNGKYALSFQPSPGQGYYSDPVAFTVSGASVSGIQLTVHQGISIAGVVTVEGNDDPQVLSRLPDISLALISMDPSGGAGFQIVKPSADGAFQAAGVRPGKLNARLLGFRNPKGFWVVRLERDGVPQPDGFDVTAGERITGIHVVLGYQTGVLRGIVNVQGGTLPPGTVIIVTARQISGPSDQLTFATGTVAQGRFEINNLGNGQYEVTAACPDTSVKFAQQPQLVTISGGQSQEVNLTVNFSGKK